MIHKHARDFLVLLFALLLTACSNSQQGFVDRGSLLLSEPEPVSQRLQMVVARYTHVIYTASMNDQERAELLYQRGITYDAMGLSSLAIIDYNEALRLKPDLAAAHNSVGVHHIQRNNYLQAYESFDASLEIDPEYSYALRNRGVALYYGGRAELATNDTLAFWNLDKTNAYSTIWLYITEAKSDPISALENLRERRALLDENDWTIAIIDMFLGKKNEAGVIARLLNDVKSQAELNNRLCEAYFYIGKYHAAKGNDNIAINYFKLALSTNVFEYVEHKYARLEISNIRRSASQ